MTQRHHLARLAPLMLGVALSACASRVPVAGVQPLAERMTAHITFRHGVPMFEVNRPAYVAVFTIDDAGDVRLAYPTNLASPQEARWIHQSWRVAPGWYAITSRSAFGSLRPLQYVMIASAQPLMLERLGNARGNLRHAFGVRRVRGGEDLADRLTDLILPLQPDEDWAIDVQYVWPQETRPWVPLYAVERLVCTDGRVLGSRLVPLEFSPYDFWRWWAPSALYQLGHLTDFTRYVPCRQRDQRSYAVNVNVDLPGAVPVPPEVVDGGIRRPPAGDRPGRSPRRPKDDDRSEEQRRRVTDTDEPRERRDHSAGSSPVVRLEDGDRARPSPPTESPRQDPTPRNDPPPRDDPPPRNDPPPRHDPPPRPDTPPARVEQPHVEPPRPEPPRPEPPRPEPSRPAPEPGEGRKVPR